MKISIFLDDLLFDLEDFEPQNLNDIVYFVREHECFKAITLLLSNSKKSFQYFIEQCHVLMDEDNIISDIQLAGLLVIVGEIDGEGHEGMVSRASQEPDYYWSRTMAASYLLREEVISESLRQSA